MWDGKSSTSGLRRRIDELAAYLFREDNFPAGVVLATGTSLVPDLPFTLEAGDEIRIAIPGIGELVNPVVRGKAGVGKHQHFPRVLLWNRRFAAACPAPGAGHCVRIGPLRAPECPICRAKLHARSPGRGAGGAHGPISWA